VVVALLASVSPARGQGGAAAPSVEFLPRYSFHLNAEHLSSDDPRFVWDTNFGGAIDFVDYGAGRVTFVANYQAILGEQFRSFDPNQGNYVLAALASARPPGFEAAAVFYHQSRHLSDRIKRQAVDWNMIGGRVNVSRTRGRLDLSGRADVRGVILKSYVDYRWELDGDARTQYRVNAPVAVFAGGGVRVLGVDGTQDRGTQHGFRGEGGVRLEGRGAAVELFVAAERRIDPYPLDFSTARWVSAGFRLLSR
jgi:hypothetical protein